METFRFWIHFKYVPLLLLSSFLGTISGNGRFTKYPPNPIEAKLGTAARFDWAFSPDPSYRLHFAYWAKLNKEGNVISPYIMVQNPGDSLPRVVTGNVQFNNRVQSIYPSTMQIRETKVEDDGTYRIHVTFSDYHTISHDVRLIILVAPKVTIRSPATVQVTEGTNVQLDCGATVGNPKPFTFVWKRGDTVIKSGKNDTRFDLRLNNTGRNEKATYSCAILNKAGSDSYSVTLDVLYRPVVISLPPVTGVREDGQAFIECVLNGNPNIVTYMWYRDVTMKTKVVPSGNINIDNNGRRLVFFRVSRKMAGDYFCVGQNSIGIGVPKRASLDVKYPPGAIDIPSTNGVVTVTEGQNVTIKCLVDANPRARFTWYRSNYIVKENSESGDLTIPYVTSMHDAMYTCKAANLYGQQSKTVRLNVRYGPRMTNLTVAGIGGTYVTIKDRPANLSCVTDSNPPANFYIRRRGTTQGLGSVKGFYYITKVTETDEGVYECVANNNVGAPNTASLILVVAVKPSFINLGANQPETVREGTMLEIDCTVKSKPAPSLYWHLNNVNLTANDTERTITIGQFGMQGLETRMRSLIRINRVRRSDAGNYKCIAENLAGVVSRVFNLNVQYTPYILPGGNISNITTFENKRVEMNCRAQGNPAISHYKWTLNGRILTSIRGPSLVIVRVTRNDAGRYTCAGVNALGVGEETVANLNVLYVPVIVVKPIPVTVDKGANIVLICKAVGYPLPVIYWFQNEKLVHKGETLAMNNVGRLQKGKYACIASNNLGNGTATATVLVRDAPFITTNTPSFIKVGADIGERATLICTVDAYPVATLKWKLKGVDIVSGLNGYEIEKSGDTSYLRIRISTASRQTRYLCEAANTLGKTSQEYEVMPKGPPEPPVSQSMKAVDFLQQTDPPTSNVRLSWVPGYTGGYSVETFLYYWIKGFSARQELNLGNLPLPEYTVRNLRAGTIYEFTIRVRNRAGVSREYSPYFQFRTSSPPPLRASASVEQYGSSGTEVLVKWTLKDASQATSILIKYKKVNEAQFTTATAPVTQVSHIIRGLEKGTTYEFQIMVYYKDGTPGWPVGAGKLIPGGGVNSSARSKLSKNEIIAIVVAIGGFLVLLIIGIALFIFRRKNKGFVKRDPRVEFTTAGSVRSGYGGYTTGGSDVVRTTYMEEDNERMLEEKQPNSEIRNSPPPKYSDVHYYNGSLDSRTSTFQPRNPVGNTPAYSSLSRQSKRRESDKGGDLPSKAPSHTSLSSNRAAEITRTQRNPHEIDYGGHRSRNARENPQYASDGSMDNLSHNGRGQRPRPGVENPRYRPDSQNFGMRGTQNVPVTNLDFDDQTAHYNSTTGGPVRGSSSDENLSDREPEANEQMLAPLLDSTASDEEMPVPPQFIRDALRTPSDSERVPGSLGAAAADRIGRKKPQNDRAYPERAYYPERQSYNDGRASPQAPHSPSSSRSGASSRPYRSDNEYIDDVDDSNYVGYLV